MSVHPNIEIPADIQGFTASEVQAQRAQGLGNPPPLPTSRTYFQILRENVFTFINGVIFFLGVALFLVHRPLDALTSVGIITLNILVSVVQEIRAKRTLDRIALLTRPQATVIRERQFVQVPPEELVVGDVLYVGAGDQIVLDGKVLHGTMSVDESQLTGESNLITKQVGDEVYSGSFCVSGSAFYIAEKVGNASLANQITAGARAFRRILTPLQQEVALVVRVMLLVVIYLEFLLFLNAFLRVLNLGDTLQRSTLIAGLVPNGLFLSISIAYAIGAVRIIRFGVLVQQANAIESLSNVNVLCLDKTGTLTTNQLVVNSLTPYSLSEQEFARILGDMATNTAAPNKTSQAIATKYPVAKRPILAEIPFSSARKWSAVAFANGASAPTANSAYASGTFALGAPEMLKPFLAASSAGVPAWTEIEQTQDQLAAQGLRILLAAYAPTIDLQDNGDASQLPQNLTPLGLVSMSDELRPEAEEALQNFIHAGVSPKIISGDNPSTVAALARQAGLKDFTVVSGLDLDKLNDSEFSNIARTATVFGRISPRQKQKLVESLRADGRYVAMIGDGVNDVLSLKQANLGIAMQSGTQAARAVADLVLTDDSFAALAPAVIEGQRIVNGMQDILKLFMTRIATMVFVITSALVIGEFPLELRQGSLVTLFSVGIPTVMLALWARPGPIGRNSMGRRLLHFILTPVIVTTVLSLLVFYGTLIGELFAQMNTAGIPPGTSAQEYIGVLLTARSTLVAFLVLVGLLTVIFVEPPTEWWTGGDRLSGDWKPTILAVGLMIVFFIIVVVKPARDLFAVGRLGVVELTVAIAATVIWLFTVRFLWRQRVFEKYLGVKDVDY